MYDVVVIGGGVVGGMIARELSKYELGICILEMANDVAMGATKANSAIVHAGFDAKEGSLTALLNVRGSKMMEKVCSELGVKYQKNGSLVIGFNDEDRRTLEELLERGNTNGVPGLKIVDREELLGIEPGIGDAVTCALIAPTGAIVCPYELCMAAIGNAMDNGVELKLGFEVASIERSVGFVITSKRGETVKASRVINCAGLFADEIAKMAGYTDFEIKPRRGEYMLLDRECGGTVSHTVFRCPSKMGKGILVSPTVDGNLLLGPTAEDIDDKTDTRTTAAGLASVRAQANEQVKGIDMSKVITSFTGLRATGSTGDFIINEKNGFVNAAGIESPGLSASPAIAEMVKDMIEAKKGRLTEKKDFNPIRKPMHYFREADIDTKNEIIKNDKTFGKIVCRCEGVTEGEILDAIRTNPKALDLDGVKRRTRGQMGRCQGGFCTPYIMKLISKELNIPYESVTKRGGNSTLVTGKTKEVDN